MKVKQIIERVTRIRPGAYDDDALLEWIAEADGQYREWINDNFAGGVEVIEKYNMDTDLIAEAPHDRIYGLYIIAQTDAMNGEDDYNNTALIYNNAADEWRKEYHRTHRRKERTPVSGVW